MRKKRFRFIRAYLPNLAGMRISLKNIAATCFPLLAIMISPIKLSANIDQYLVGAYYFGGWQKGANYHLGKPQSLLLTPPYQGRKPLNGWHVTKQWIIDSEITQAVRGRIDYFAFLWYWPEALNSQEDKLNAPLELFLSSTSKNRKDIKFCIVYTNHDKFDITPGPEWNRYTTLWTEWMCRDDYVRVGLKEGEPPKPLFIVWSPQRFHEHWKSVPGGARSAFDGLRAEAIQAGLPGINIAGCWDQSGSMETFTSDGYDIITGYNFHGAGTAKAGKAGRYGSLAVGHQPIWDSMAALGKPVIPVITSGWDPRPWPYTLKGSPYYPDRTPEKFQDFCQLTKDWMDSKDSQLVIPKTVLIYAWNELGEGGYILPTVGEGYSYLNAVKKVFGRKKETVRRNR